MSRRRAGPSGNPGQELRLATVSARAKEASQKVREVDPTWQSPRSFTTQDNIESQIAHQEAVAQAAEARLADIMRDAVPNTNPSWGVNRLTKELYDRGFRLEGPADSPGRIYQNALTGEEIRIMESPTGTWPNDPSPKHWFSYYYRYRANRNLTEGRHVPIPDKE